MSQAEKEDLHRRFIQALNAIVHRPEEGRRVLQFFSLEEGEDGAGCSRFHESDRASRFLSDLANSDDWSSQLDVAREVEDAALSSSYRSALLADLRARLLRPEDLGQGKREEFERLYREALAL